MKSTYWIIGIGIVMIGIIAYFILKGGAEKEVTTSTGTQTSNETNGLLGAIGGFLPSIGGLFTSKPKTTTPTEA